MLRREGWGKHFPPIDRKSILRSSDSTELTVADAVMSSRIAPESLKYQPLAARAAASCDCGEEEAVAAMANPRRRWLENLLSKPASITATWAQLVENHPYNFPP